MIAGQKLKGKNGKEVMLFPLPYMYISQGEGGSYSHAGTYNMDFMGWGANGRVYNCPYYAPCKCICVWAGGVDNIRIFQSLNQVNRADGSVGYVTFLFMHDDDPIATVGSIFAQGDIIGHTGTAGNVTGDHVHFNTAFGQYAGTEHVPPDNQYQLVNSSHIYDTCYVNGTNIIEGYNYNWKEFNNSNGYRLSNKFNFVLFGYYAKRKRKW